MAFNVPRHLPDFGSQNRDLEDHAWSSLRGAGARDKPFTYTPSYKNRPLWRKKRFFGGITMLVVFALYMLGFWSSPEVKSKPATAKSAWSWIGMSNSDKVDWEERRQAVVEAFQVSWDAYERYAWGYDEFHPVAKTGKNMAPQGLGWIIIDSLDTMILMNQTSRLQHARQWISESLTWEQNQDVSTFETTIRMLGGLLSAHYLQTEFPNLAPLEEDDEGAAGEDLYLEKAKDLADRLLSAFESPSGVPYSSVNLEKFKGIPSHDDQGAASTAEALSVQLEFKYLAKLTGEKYFWDKVEKVMEIADDNNPRDGLVPIYMHPINGEFKGENIRLGSRGDSYYEYLIKQYLQTNKEEPIYQEMWKESLAGVRKHLVTYTEPSGYTIIGERPSGLNKALSPKMDHLVCFYPGTIALAVTGGLTEAEARKLPTWSQQDEDDMQLAHEITQTCWGMYKYMATGLAAEITYFNIAKPPLMDGQPHNVPPATFDPDPDASWRKDFIVKNNDQHNLQRPETLESLFYMWRITGDIKYREWGWEMFKSFLEYEAVEDKGGFTGLANANTIPPRIKDNMESFWIAESLKYLYLLFSDDDLLPLDKVVLNTEGHPFPRFSMGPLFSTGWQRKPRDANGDLVGEPTP
ncbi:glycoside hydrolase family 47 protein [Emericellopsis atlantica]|uniref:alpha-1,2-Mannosidase n=1 Tax=Emericellopsis atlantica TaxID=2614577 RepID=A0A9P7ZKH0_9HYPO|nr:glycoside hydrolase family 47 protein [Emericellopsis atlantica]KAG9253250.1 glycoside hydrolase family 47 protein [Emericellopsis atlantica]